MDKKPANAAKPTTPLKATVAGLEATVSSSEPVHAMAPGDDQPGLASIHPSSHHDDTNGPAVIAQPPVPGSEHAGGHLHPVRSAAPAASRSASAAPAADTRNARATMPSAGDVKRLFSDARDVLNNRYRNARDATDDRVHRSPWQGVALAALAGLVVGLLASR